MSRRSFVVSGFVALGCLLALAWQTGWYASLADRARRLEASQSEWVEENRKLESGISALSNRSRAAAQASGSGLVKAGADRRIRLVVNPGETE